MIVEMRSGLLEVVAASDIATTAWEGAMYRIADLTDMTALEVETMADRWGFVLSDAADEARFYFKLYEQYKTYRDDEGKLKGMTRDSFLANATGMIATGIENSVFVTGTKGQRTREARVQSQAANQVLFDALQAGDLDEATARVLFQDVLKTTASVGAAMGLEGSQLGTFVTTAASGLAASAKRSGYTFDTSRLSPLVETMTGIGGLPTNITAYKETELGKMMVGMMVGSGRYAGTEGTARMNERLTQIMQGPDPEGALALLNLEIHSDAALEAAVALAEVGGAAMNAAYALNLIAGVESKFGVGGGLAGEGARARPMRTSATDKRLETIPSRAPGEQFDQTRKQELSKARVDFSKWDWGATGLAWQGIKNMDPTFGIPVHKLKWWD
jgi:hypothetical protein